ncbi:MAG: hypothetical protein ACOC8D_00455 [bacterium]
MKARIPTLVVLMVLALAAAALGGEAVPLIDPAQPRGGWTFGNGPEFPGARGTLELADEPFRGKPVLSLHGDFTEGGNYVQAWVPLPKTEVETLSFWVNAPAGSKRLPIRFTDADDKVHQINLKLNAKGGWQHIDLPIARFFETMGTPDALDIVVGYETWGGAQDRKKHGKPRQDVPNLAILASRAMGTAKGTILISEALFHPRAEAAATVTRTIPLDEMLQAGEMDWGFNLGQEFPGARGGLELVRDQPKPGRNAMRLHADFTGGGAYVGVRKTLSHLDVERVEAIRLRMRSQTTSSYGLRLVDETGQCHQRKGLPFQADGAWHEVVLRPTEIAGGEHWGGANDGTWHGAVRLIELMLNTRSHEGKEPDLLITDMRADVVAAARVKPAAFAEDFEDAKAFQKKWKTAGNVSISKPGYGDTAKALLLRRTLETTETKTSASSPSFAVNAGSWRVQYAWKAALHSPDNSYHGRVALEVTDRGGAVIETLPVGIGYGEKDWEPFSKTIALPRNAATARFRIELRKTYGSFWLDALSASPLSVEPVERRIERILLETEAVGNLFLPGDAVAFRATVEAVKPLPEPERVLRYSVRDYWGAEQMPPGEVTLSRQPREKGRFLYAAEIALPAERLAEGRFHELHVAVPQDGGEPVREFSGFAILPPAVTKKHEPERVPFTIRNWDSRVPAYFHLADRLGLRMLGLWGGWSPKPPYKPHCPRIELCEKLGAKWVTGTPASRVEREGFATYSEEALRKGMRNFLEAYADRGLAMIALGNEPHGTGQKVLDNVRAYKAIYQTVKAYDPTTHVIGTSVEPNEEYFKAGYQSYLDSYDFHIYEHYSNVRRTMRAYRGLMRKYDAIKPIHSTELGLNSQGRPRIAVARELIKKCTVFFAEGGATVSWFTIQYPDPKGKARGQFGDAHCVFDCKYNLYSPRLDAIAYYNMLNGVCIKKFVAEKRYPCGAQAYLFRDERGRCLQVLWLDGKREDALVSVPTRRDVELVHIDGSRTVLRSGAGGVTVTLSDDPTLLLYDGGDAALAEALGTPSVALAAAPDAVEPGGTKTLALTGRGLTTDAVRVQAPPLWKTSLGQAGEGRVAVTVEAPPRTPAREVRLRVQRLAAGSVVGQLTVPLRIAGDH